MIESLSQWVLSILTISILFIIIDIILPSSKIKKIINLVAGFIVLIVILKPVVGFINKGIDLNSIQISNSNYMDVKEIENKSKSLGESQMQQIIKIYKEKLSNQAIESIKELKGIKDVSAKIEINEDTTSGKFGEVKKIDLLISFKENENEVKSVAKVQNVVIGKKPPIIDNEKKIDSETQKNIESKLKELFLTNKENISIKVSK